MRCHITHLIPRMIRVGLANRTCRFRVVAAGIDYRNRIISIASNRPRLETRGLHAEERVIFTSPKTLTRILILRVGARGDLLPIDPCRMCAKLARDRGIEIVSIRA